MDFSYSYINNIMLIKEDKLSLSRYIIYLFFPCVFMFFCVVLFDKFTIISIILLILGVYSFLTIISILFLSDLKINQNNKFIYYKSIFPFLLKKIRFNNINYIKIEIVETNNIGTNGWRNLSKTVFIIAHTKENREVWMAGLNVPNRLIYNESQISSSINQLKNTLTDLGLKVSVSPHCN